MGMKKYLSRRNAMKAIAGTASLSGVGNVSANSSNGEGDDISTDLRKLVDRHGEYYVSSEFLYDGEEVGMNTFNNYRPETTEETPPTYIGYFRFQDGYSTFARTSVDLDSKQMSEFTVADNSVGGSIQISSSLGNKEYTQEVAAEDLRRKEEEASAMVSAMSNESEVASVSATSSAPEITPGEWTTDISDDGLKRTDWTLPLLNASGANYKTNDNRCGVAQRSQYISVDARGKAEIYRTARTPALGLADATVTVSGSVSGVVSNIAMGGTIRFELFIRSNRGYEEAETLGEYSLNSIADVRDIEGVEFGPDSGPIVDKPRFDYQIEGVDMPSGTVEVGLRNYVGVSGFRGGITQANFMPKKRFWQPGGFGIEYDQIEVDW